MRSKSQQLMNEISAYVDQYYSERHTAPSVNEIAKGVGIAKTTSYRYLARHFKLRRSICLIFRQPEGRG